jgi:hypothetical protein
MGHTVLLPLQSKARCGIFRPKNPTALEGTCLSQVAAQIETHSHFIALIGGSY